MTRGPKVVPDARELTARELLGVAKIDEVGAEEREFSLDAADGTSGRAAGCQQHDHRQARQAAPHAAVNLAWAVNCAA